MATTKKKSFDKYKTVGPEKKTSPPPPKKEEDYDSRSRGYTDRYGDYYRY